MEGAAKSLARLENSRRELLANISHDLKTPLMLICGYAEKIEDLSWQDRGECRGAAAVIKREAKRLTLLVNDILDYSVLQSGSVAFDFQRVHLSGLVENVIRQFHFLCRQQNIVIEQNIEPGLYAIADEQRISQVFYNLIINAITHVGGDKLVGVRMYQMGNFIRAEIWL